LTVLTIQTFKQYPLHIRMQASNGSRIIIIYFLPAWVKGLNDRLSCMMANWMALEGPQ
jgi:hypothetical protein